MHHDNLNIQEHLNLDNKSVFVVDSPKSSKAAVWGDSVPFNKGDTFDFGSYKYRVFKVFSRIDASYSLHATRI